MTPSEEARSDRGEAGFSLLEVIIALVILLTVLVSVSSLMVTEFKVGANSRFRQVATEIATGTLDSEVQTGSAALIGQVGDSALATVTSAGQSYVGELEVTPYTPGNAACASPQTGLAMLKITVWETWADVTSGSSWWVSGASGATGLLVEETTLVALPPTAFDSSEGTLLVDVTGATGSGVQGATVTITPASGGSAQTAVTTESGCALFANLATGNWTVGISKTGYIDALDDWSSTTNSAVTPSYPNEDVTAGNVLTVAVTYDQEATVTPSFSVTLAGKSPWLPTNLSAMPLTFYTSYVGSSPPNGYEAASPGLVFPYTSSPSYYVVAGSCGTESAPDGASLAGATTDGQPVTLTSGSSASPVFPLTPVNLVVTDGGTAVSNASVSAAVSGSDANCGTGTLAMPTLSLGTTCAGSACASEVAYRTAHAHDHEGVLVSNCTTPCTTTTTVATSGSPSIYGAPVTFTATVTCTGTCATAPQGTVNFYDGGVSIGSGTLNGASPDKATYTTTVGQLATQPTSNSITAQYASSNTFTWKNSAVSSSINQNVNKAGTTTVLASNPNPNSYGTSAILTATVTAASPSAANPTGTVNFTNSGTSLAGCSAVALTAGAAGVSTANCTWSALSAVNGGTTYPTVVGTYTASTGPTNFTGSASAALSQSVIADSSTTTLATSAPFGAATGTSITFTATMAIYGGSTPAGTVAFTENGVAIAGCTAAPVSSSKATCTTSALPAGNLAIKAVYTPTNTTNYASSNNTLTQVVVGSGTPSILSGLPYGVWILTVTYGSNTATYTLTVTPGFVQVGGAAKQTAGTVIVLAD